MYFYVLLSIKRRRSKYPLPAWKNAGIAAWPMLINYARKIAASTQKEQLKENFYF
jgi:hypothetical protein